MADEAGEQVLQPGAASFGSVGLATFLHGTTRAFVHLASRFMPDPFVLAAALTLVVFLAAILGTPSTGGQVLDAWYAGLFDVMPFAMSMALILATGVALARAPVIRRLLGRMASVPKTQASAATAIFLTSAICCWLNWGFGLVVGALLAREIAKRLPLVDFSFLTASAYMGFMVWASGLSSSIALASATHDSQLNFLERLTGTGAGFSQTIFTTFNLLPVAVVLVVIPIALGMMAPRPAEMKRVDPEVLRRQDDAEQAELLAVGGRAELVHYMENGKALIIPLVMLGVAYKWHEIMAHGLMIDLNGFVFVALILGLALHGNLLRYAQAFYAAARTTGPILLQFPIYGGIMGIMAHAGLAGLIAKTFVEFATPGTLAFFSFVSSCVVSLFVPSGGGQWAVVGPFVIPAAIQMHASPAMAEMGTAMGVQTASMIQPFWALPVLALARLGINDIMGYCVIAMLIGFVVYGGALLAFGTFG